MANWALVKTINNVETVDNVIVASQEVAETYLIANSGDYEYVLDISLYSPQPGPGWSYDSGLDSFSPPPEDFQAELEAALIAVDTALEAARDSFSLCNETQRSNAIGIIITELSDEPQDEQDLMVDIITWLQNGV